MIWRSINYDWPNGAFLLLLTLPIGWMFYILYRYRQKKLDAFADSSIRNVLIERRLPISFWTKVMLCSIIWIGGVLALMQPKGNERYMNDSTIQNSTTPHPPMQHVIILMDTSASMAVMDSRNQRSRLDASKEVVDSIISSLKGEQVALLAFTSATLPIVPLTNDYLFTRMMTEQVEINEEETTGTDIKQALVFVGQKYFKNVFPTALKTLILLSDGGDTHLETLQGKDVADYSEQIIQPLTEAGLEKLRVVVVALGSRNGGEVPQVKFHGNPVHSSVNLKLLQQISMVNEGLLLDTETLTSQQIAETVSLALKRQALEGTSIETSLSQQKANEYIYDLYYQIPLAISLIAFMLFLCIPDTRRKRSMGAE